MKTETKLVLFLAFLSLVAVCSAQVTYYGALTLGKINSEGGTSGEYDPSNEFNSLVWPDGYGWKSYDYSQTATMTGSALSISSGGGEAIVSSPVGDWQIDVKLSLPDVSDTVKHGIRVYGQDGSYFYLAIQADGSDYKAYLWGDSVSTTSAALTLSAAYLRAIRTGTDVDFYYSTDGNTYTEIALDPGGLTPSLPESAALAIGLYGGLGGAEDVEFDYCRFTQ